MSGKLGNWGSYICVLLLPEIAMSEEWRGICVTCCESIKSRLYRYQYDVLSLLIYDYNFFKSIDYQGIIRDAFC